MAVFLSVFALLALASAGPDSPCWRGEAHPVCRDTIPADTVRPVGIARPDTVLPLPSVTVRATPPTLTEGQRRTTLSAAAMEAAGAQSVADLLEARTGFFVRHYGAGGLATASLRGTSSQQTLLLLDGQRLADPQTGQADLSLLPTALLRSAEVTYGASSARYGSGAFGGVVRLNTLRATQQLRLRIVGETGAWDERGGSAVLSGGGKHLTGLLATEVRTSDNDFSYDGDGLSVRPGRRDGAGREQHTLFGKVRYERGRHAVQALGWYADAERGLPGRINARPSQARQWDRHLRLQVEDVWHQPWGLLRLNARGQSTWRRYHNPAPGNPTARTDDTTRTRTLTLGAQAEGEAGGVTLAGGVEAGLDHAQLRGGVRRVRTAAFADAAVRWGRLRLAPALRLDALSAEGGRRSLALSPRLGLNVQPTSYEGFRLKGSVGRSFRAPTFSERFNEPGGTPDLRPEVGWSVDVGAAWHVERARWRSQLEATAFAARMDDRIVWHPTYVGAGVQVWRPSNVSRVVTRGLETSARGQWKPADCLTLGGGVFFTQVRVENRSNPSSSAYGKHLAHRPEQQLKFDFNARVALGGGHLLAGLNGRLVGPRFVAADESDAVPAYQVLDARLRYEHIVGPLRLGAGLWVENAAAEEYQIVRFYPMPPRHLRLRLTLETAR